MIDEDPKPRSDSDRIMDKDDEDRVVPQGRSRGGQPRGDRANNSDQISRLPFDWARTSNPRPHARIVCENCRVPSTQLKGCRGGERDHGGRCGSPSSQSQADCAAVLGCAEEPLKIKGAGSGVPCPHR